jgi:hypothetical protein
MVCTPELRNRVLDHTMLQTCCSTECHELEHTNSNMRSGTNNILHKSKTDWKSYSEPFPRTLPRTKNRLKFEWNEHSPTSTCNVPLTIRKSLKRTWRFGKLRKNYIKAKSASFLDVLFSQSFRSCSCGHGNKTIPVKVLREIIIVLIKGIWGQSRS